MKTYNESERNCKCLHCGLILTKGGIKYHLRPQDSKTRVGNCPMIGKVPSPKKGVDWDYIKDFKLIHRARLSFEEKLTARSWLIKNKCRIVKEGLTKSQVAKEISNLLGELVTTSQLTQVFSSVKIKWPGVKTIIRQSRNNAELFILTKSLKELYNKVGIIKPQELEDLYSQLLGVHNEKENQTQTTSAN